MPFTKSLNLFFGNSGKVILAGAFGFSANITRDILIISKTNQSESIFNILYIAGVASLTCINSITFSKKQPHTYELNIFYIISAMACIGLLLINKINFIDSVITLVITYVWVNGSFYSKILLLKNYYFVARIREAISSILISFFIIFGLNTKTSLLCGIIAGGIFVFLNAKKSFASGKVITTLNKSKVSTFFSNFFVINLPTLLILFWGLQMNSLQNKVFGFRIGDLARISLYAYQIFVLLSLVLLPQISEHSFKNTKFKFWIFVGLGVLGILLLQNVYGLFYVPVITSLMHFFALKFLNKKINDS